jgi:hypothetical protein
MAVIGVLAHTRHSCSASAASCSSPHVSKVDAEPGALQRTRIMAIHLTATHRTSAGDFTVAGLYGLDECTGFAELIIVDENQRETLRRLELGIFVDNLHTTITPADGSHYIDAVESYLGASSDWKSVRE